jgi:opacity protein-like surface antigen
MRRRLALALALVVILTWPASPAAAQTTVDPSADQQVPPKPPPQPAKPQPKPVVPRRNPGPGVGAYGLFDTEWMTAKNTFDAVFETSQLQSMGVGGEAFNLFRGLFARVTYSKVSKTGSRVAVVNEEAIPLNISLELKLGTTEVGGGWRVPLDRRGRYNAYGGGGLLFLSYRETSEFADPGDDSRESFNGYSLFGGMDVNVWKVIFAGAEVQYRLVPDALGEGGASREFDETDLGGFVVRVMFGVRK